jgi:hypothetical protein
MEAKLPVSKKVGSAEAVALAAQLEVVRWEEAQLVEVQSEEAQLAEARRSEARLGVVPQYWLEEQLCLWEVLVYSWAAAFS